MSKTFHFPSFSMVAGDITVNISLNRFEKQFQEAQNWLDGQVFTDMEKYMPFRDGNMRNVSAIMSRSMQGSGRVRTSAHHSSADDAGHESDGGLLRV